MQIHSVRSQAMAWSIIFLLIVGLISQPAALAFGFQPQDTAPNNDDLRKKKAEADKAEADAAKAAADAAKAAADARKAAADAAVAEASVGKNAAKAAADASKAAADASKAAADAAVAEASIGKSAAEAEAAKLKAQINPLGVTPTVQVPTGGVTTDGTGFIESQMLALEAAKVIIKTLSEDLCGYEGTGGKVKTLVIYNDSDIDLQSLYRAMFDQLPQLLGELLKKHDETKRLLEATDPKAAPAQGDAQPSGFLGVLAAPSIATNVVSSVAALVNLFRTDTSFQTKSLTIDESTLVSYLVDYFNAGKRDKESPCTSGITVYYPKYFVPKSVVLENEAKLDENHRPTAVPTSKLGQYLQTISDAKTSATLDLKKVDARIKLIKSIADNLDSKKSKTLDKIKASDQLAEDAKEKKEIEKKDPNCASDRCKELKKEIEALTKQINTINKDLSDLDNSIVTALVPNELIEEKIKKQARALKEKELEELKKTDPGCTSPACTQLVQVIAAMKKDEAEPTVDVKGQQEKINKSLKDRLDVFKSDSQSWVDDLNQFTGLTQSLVDAANQIVVKLNTPDDKTKTTPMVQLLRAERLNNILRDETTFSLRASVTASGTTKIKKNLFVDAKVTHSAGANIVFQGVLVLAASEPFYYTYRSPSEIEAMVGVK